MIHTDARFDQAVEAAVGAIELRTDAEIVVVAAERSGSYDDVANAVAALGAWAALVVAIYLPHPIAPHWLLPELLLAGLLFRGLARRPALLKTLVSQARKERQTEEVAAMEFVREAVHATPDRTGVLVYVSALEERVVVLSDVGIEGRVPRGEWATAEERFGHADLDHFLAGLEALGEVLARYVPALEVDKIDLPNAPRIRP